jgi:hypothetical protein
MTFNLHPDADLQHREAKEDAGLVNVVWSLHGIICRIGNCEGGRGKNDRGWGMGENGGYTMPWGRYGEVGKRIFQGLEKRKRRDFGVWLKGNIKNSFARV